jgi:hypothetical protein
VSRNGHIEGINFASEDLLQGELRSIVLIKKHLSLDGISLQTLHLEAHRKEANILVFLLFIKLDKRVV